jgi:hypothetical protein
MGLSQKGLNNSIQGKARQGKARLVTLTFAGQPHAGINWHEKEAGDNHGDHGSSGG